MADVDLSGKPAEPEQKTKMIYLNIPTALVFIFDCWEYPKAQRFALAMKESIDSALTKKEIRKTILSLFGIKTVQKLKKAKHPAYKIFAEVFGPDLWGS